MAVQLDQDGPEQGLHVDVARVAVERRAAARLGGAELARTDQADDFVEQRLGRGGGLHAPDQ